MGALSTLALQKYIIMTLEANLDVDATSQEDKSVEWVLLNSTNSDGNEAMTEHASANRANSFTTSADTSGTLKRHKVNGDAILSREEEIKSKLALAWEKVVDDETESFAFDETVKLLAGEIELLIHSGLEAYQHWEDSSRNINSLKEEVAAKNLEIARLRTCDENSRTTIQASDDVLRSPSAHQAIGQKAQRVTSSLFQTNALSYSRIFFVPSKHPSLLSVKIPAMPSSPPLFVLT